MKKRRGIGNVIATAVMVFLIVYSVSQLYVYNIDLLDDYNQVSQSVSDRNTQKVNERLALSNVVLDTTGTMSSDILLSLTISNTGGVTSHIVAIWIDNLDQSTALHVRVPENVFVGQGLSATISSVDTGIAATPPNPRMNVKVVTELGNTVSAQLLPPSQAGTTAQTLATTQLTLVPPNPITTNVLNVVLTVSNNNQLGVAFTGLKPDICVLLGNTPPSPANCHTSAAPLCNQSSTPVSCTPIPGAYGLTVAGMATSLAQTISPSQPDTSYNVNVKPSWTTTVTITGKTTTGFTITFGTASPNGGGTLSWTLGPIASPTTLSFLPYGSSATFQWAYQVNTIIPDFQATFMASFVNLTTTVGLQASQEPFQTVTVRASGGASSSSGGNLVSVLGNIQIIYASTNILTRASKTDVGPWSSSQWSSNLLVSKASYLFLRVQVTNAGSSSITLGQNSAIFAQRLTTGSFVQFNIVFFNSATGTMTTYGGANTVTVTPNQVVTLYFGVTDPGGAPTSVNEAVKFIDLDTFLLIIGFTGTLNATPASDYGQAVPFIVVQTF